MKLKPPKTGPVAQIVGKKGADRKLRVLVYPRDGSRPYLLDVDVDEHRRFQPIDGQTVTIIPGSVTQEDGRDRAVWVEGDPCTLDVASATGKPPFGAEAADAMIHNNYILQLHNLENRRPLWKQGAAWAIGILGIIAVLVMVWGVVQVGSGFEDLADALRGLQINAAGGDPSTHQRIAPGGT